MKKLVLLLTVLLISTPVAALTLSASDLDGAGDNLVAQIGFSGADVNDLVRAFALELEVDAGTITDVNVTMNTDYYIYPGTINLADVNNPVWGSPIAPASDPGASGTGIGTTKVILEMGSLSEGDGNAPGTSGVICQVTVSSACTLTITPEAAIRAGIVLEGGLTSDANTSVVMEGGECFPSSDPNYGEWADPNIGKPECWCYKYQCHGDADGLLNGGSYFGYYQVYTEDYQVLAAGWKKQLTDPNISEWICADFDHKLNGGSYFGYYRVYTEDYQILAANWKDSGGMIPPDDCPGNVDPCDP